MRLGLTAVVALIIAIATTSLARSSAERKFYRTFKCIDNYRCQQTSIPLDSIDPDSLKAKGEHTTRSACRLVCGNNPGLWPIPTGSKLEYGHDTRAMADAARTSMEAIRSLFPGHLILKFGDIHRPPLFRLVHYVRIHPMEVLFNTTDTPKLTNDFITEAQTTLIKNLRSECGFKCRKNNSTVMTVEIAVESDDEKLDWNTNERYTLTVDTKDMKVKAVIKARTIYGARHGLETLSQLTAPVLTGDGHRGLVILDRVRIEDGPEFPHRGLLIDTARNFLPIFEIIKTIDALAATKMNVLHWHATDSQSFPLQIDRRPLMPRYGAYSSDMIYTLENLGQVVRYAKSRGVRVILELDSPSHVGAGWEWGPSEGLGNIAVCVGKEPWRDFCVQPPCGQINPVNPNATRVLRDIYKDVLNAMNGESVLHLGGDEVHINCWNSTDEITSVMKSRGMGRKMDDFIRLWGEFHVNQSKILRDIRGRDDESIILWSSALTNPETIEDHLDKNKFVIQTWVESKSDVNSELLKRGYRLIISTKDAWYLDHGFWGRTKYHSWQDAYKNRIPREKGVLGGEACMWGEYVNSGGLQSRVWPRTAAVAERLWSDPTYVNTTTILPRLEIQNERLQRRSVAVDALGPEWCTKHEQRCS